MMAGQNHTRVINGIAEAKRGNTLLGMKLLGEHEAEFVFPEAKAWHGYCLAREKNLLSPGIAMCMEAMELKPQCSDIYLALGRIYLFAGMRKPTVRILEEGLRVDKNREIERLLNTIGTRKQPVFRFLARENMVNVVSGRLFSRLGLR